MSKERDGREQRQDVIGAFFEQQVIGYLTYCKRASIDPEKFMQPAYAINDFKGRYSLEDWQAAVRKGLEATV